MDMCVCERERAREREGESERDETNRYRGEGGDLPRGAFPRYPEVPFHEFFFAHPTP